MLIATNVVTHRLVHEVPEAHLAELLTEEVVTTSKSDYVRAQTFYALMLGREVAIRPTLRPSTQRAIPLVRTAAFRINGNVCQ
ncbi:hypothetical protein ASE85_10740 [Sphingobium sp. Leaf26]|nr:hypothetical protein ASE85_10740 [Sphingobium sp. Leaf26]